MTVRIPTWIIVALSVAAPVATMAAEGKPAAGKAKAEAAGCFACHGVDGVATESGLAIDKNVPNLAGEPDLYLQFQLVFFRKGVRKNELMNAMAEQLSDDDLRNLSAYFASLPAPNMPAPPDTAPQDTELGSKVAAAIHCTNCHGDHFEGVDNIARLAGQRKDYLYKALRDFKSGARTVDRRRGHGGGGVPARRHGDESARPLHVAAALSAARENERAAARSARPGVPPIDRARDPKSPARVGTERHDFTEAQVAKSNPRGPPRPAGRRRRDVTRRGLIEASAGAAAAAIASRQAFAQEGDNLPPSIPEWQRQPGAEVMSPPYGRPSRFEANVVRR